MRVEAGAVVDEFEVPGVGQVVARHAPTKTPDGGVTWACTFTVLAAGVSDLAVVHRLSAPSLAEGRRSVREAVEYLTGRTPLGPEAPDLQAPGTSLPQGTPPPAGGSLPQGTPPPAGGSLPQGMSVPPLLPALAPTRAPHNRRATDRADRGRVPDFSSIVADGAPRFPVFDFSRAEPSSDADSSLDPEPAP